MHLSPDKGRVERGVYAASAPEPNGGFVSHSTPSTGCTVKRLKRRAPPALHQFGFGKGSSVDREIHFPAIPRNTPSG